MKNLRSAKALAGYAVHATDGEMGTVRELYFNDLDWSVKYFVVDTGRWVPGRKVLLPPSAASDIVWEQRTILFRLTGEQIRNSPGIDTDRPVVLQRRAERRARRNWPLLLAGEALTSVPEALETPAATVTNKDGKRFDPHLRTTRFVTRLALRARDEAAGRVVDFIVDDESWIIRYLVVELPTGRRVLLPPKLVKGIDVDDAIVTTDLPAHAVVDGPALDPSTLLTSKYEDAVLRHYQNEDLLFGL